MDAINSSITKCVPAQHQCSIHNTAHPIVRGVLFIYLFIYLLTFSLHLLQVNWGSSSQAFTFIQALRFARRLDGIDDHVKNFRPHCLVLTGPPQDRPNLTHLASQITKNVSLMVYGNVIKKEFGALPSNTADTLWIRENKIKAFQAVTTGMNACIFFPFLRRYDRGGWQWPLILPLFGFP